MLYGALRIVMALLTQGRDALFASVAMNAVRRLAFDVFVHLHDLSLRYHLERKTGGLTRVLERGRNAIETIVRMIMLTGLPTAVEFALIIGVFLFQFSWVYAVVVIVMIMGTSMFGRESSSARVRSIPFALFLTNERKVAQCGAEKRRETGSNQPRRARKPASRIRPCSNQPNS